MQLFVGIFLLFSSLQNGRVIVSLHRLCNSEYLLLVIPIIQHFFNLKLSIFEINSSVFPLLLNKINKSFSSIVPISPCKLFKIFR